MKTSESDVLRVGFRHFHIFSIFSTHFFPRWKFSLTSVHCIPPNLLLVSLSRATRQPWEFRLWLDGLFGLFVIVLWYLSTCHERLTKRWICWTRSPKQRIPSGGGLPESWFRDSDWYIITNINMWLRLHPLLLKYFVRLRSTFAILLVQFSFPH